jgi:hypothetical protein
MRRLAGLISAATLVCTVGCGQTDTGISTAVKTKLATNDLVQASQVNVDTKDHIVTLSGDVETVAAKLEAVRVARTTDGVRDVIDRLTVDATPTAATTGVDDHTVGDRVDQLGDDTQRGVDATGRTVERGAAKAGAATDRGIDAARSGIENGADATAEGVKKGAEATKEGAKKVVGKVKGAVTDDNRDSDGDGH